MERRVAIALLVVGLGLAAYPTLASPPALPQERAFTLTVTAVACPGFGIGQPSDGVCLAYNGQVPGPTLDVNLGDTVLITLQNRIAATVANATTDAALIAHLQNASISWHVHGTALGNEMDGVPIHAGTKMIESIAHPNADYTYRVRTAFAGSWHYHDHVLGLDGSEGVARGLYGGLIVRPAGEPRPAAVFDLHILDAGANGGRNLAGAATTGDRFEVLVAGLGNVILDVQLRSPTNALLSTIRIGPGMSDRFVVEDAAVGTYKLRVFGSDVGVVVVSP